MLLNSMTRPFDLIFSFSLLMFKINPNERSHFIAFYIFTKKKVDFEVDFDCKEIPDLRPFFSEMDDRLYSILIKLSIASHTDIPNLLLQLPDVYDPLFFPFLYANPILVGLINKTDKQKANDKKEKKTSKNENNLVNTNKINNDSLKKKKETSINSNDNENTKEAIAKKVIFFYEKERVSHQSYIKQFTNLKRQTEGSGTLKDTLNKFKKYKGVITRFPPEPSGYLHLGHAKAALLNNYFATQCNGMLRLRFDDTNPLKEDQNFVDCIIEDLKLLNITKYELSYTSDYFDTLIDYAKKMIQSGKAYCDNTEIEIMRLERSDGTESKNRNLSIEENMKIFESMIDGRDKKSCLRAKIDMKSKNKALCDPVLYRYVEGAHHKTSDKYKIYPTYDFACPIVDSLEEITCALRTNEYRDRNEQYKWILQSLELRIPDIVDFSKLVFENTVLSKRKLKQLVETEEISWDDPRMPTLRGIKRLGMRLDALRNYILLQGMNDKITKISWDKIWAFNKKELEMKSGKYYAIEKGEAKRMIITDFEELRDYVKVNFEIVERSIEKMHDTCKCCKNKSNHLSNIEDEFIHKCSLHNLNDDQICYKTLKNIKNENLGYKTVCLKKEILISNENYTEGEEITLMNLGNFVICKDTLKFVRDGDYKKTKIKTQWVTGSNTFVINEYTNLFVNDEYNKDSHYKKEYIGEEALLTCKVDDVVQFERDGFYYCDKHGFNLVPFTKQPRKK